MAACDRIGVETARIEFTLPGYPAPVLICTPDFKEPISKSRDVICRSEGFDDAKAAERGGARMRDALRLTMARLDMGADFGERSPNSFFTRYGLALVEQHVGKRTLNDVHGLMTFESEPPPAFASVGQGQLIRTMQPERFGRVLEAAISLPVPVPERQSLAFELYHASFFEVGGRSRFLTLMTAVDALGAPALRSDPALAHVDKLVAATAHSEILTPSERDSLLGGLSSLRQVSARAKGRALAEVFLPDRLYEGLSAPDFFSRCYALRNKMVHGGEAVDDHVVGPLAASMETFVSHLLGHPLRHLDA